LKFFIFHIYLKKLDFDKAYLIIKNNGIANTRIKPIFIANHIIVNINPASFNKINPPIIANPIEKIVLIII